MKKIEFAALLMIVACVACAPTGSQDGSAIDARSRLWENALNEGDLEAVVSLYTSDARILPPNAPAGQGPDAVRASFEEMFAAGLGGTLDTTEARMAGDIGYRVGVYTLTAPDGSVVDRGKYIETWRLENGEWKISNDIWNSDMPAAGAGTTMIITHQVKDADHWIAAFDPPTDRRGDFAENGVTSLRQFQSQEDPSLMALLLEVADVDAFMAFVTADETAHMKKEDGVIDKGLRTFGEVN